MFTYEIRSALCLESYFLNKKCIPLRQSFSEPLKPSKLTFRNLLKKNHPPIASFFFSWFFFALFCFCDALNHLSPLLSKTSVRASLVQSNILGLAGYNAGLIIKFPMSVKELETLWNKALIQSQLKSVGFFSIDDSAIVENLQFALWWDCFGWPYMLYSSVQETLSSLGIQDVEKVVH